MKFELEIESDNAAFHPNPEQEIRRLLNSVDPNRAYGKLMDINGNVVGAWSLDKPDLMIELYPMTETGTLAQTHDEVFTWDVLVRPDGGDSIEEHENLSYDHAQEMLSVMERKYPEAILDTQLEDLLK